MAEIAEAIEVPDKGGWLWKYSVGKSFFTKKNWKMRYLKITLEGIFYYAQEPFDSPKGSIRWDEVTHIYNSVNSDVDAGADDPRQFYFGVRFTTSGSEKLLLLRVDTQAERDSWTNHFTLMRNEHQRIQMLVDTDDDEDNKSKMRTNRSKGGFLMEKLAVKLRGMVSLKKQRYQKDGFDLDLAYITPQIIAMGFPSEGREAVYRNPMEQVVQFLEKHHAARYKVYNLCSERSYPPSRFGGRFGRFPFDDHNPCPLDMLYPMCLDIHRMLTSEEDVSSSHHFSSPAQGGSKDVLKPTTFEEQAAQTVELLETLNHEFQSTLPESARNLVLTSRKTVAIHCKAGKGRTGLVICAYLMFSGLCPTAVAALKFFGDQRTKDGKGVQIPSQKRYLGYFETLLRDYRDSIQYPPVAKVLIRTVTLSSAPHFDPDGGCDPYLLVMKRKDGHMHVPCGTKEGNYKDQMITVYDSREGHPVKHISGKTANFQIPLMRHFEGELSIVIFDHDQTSRDDKMCSFWIHTGFLPPTGRYSMKKYEIDDAVKDKKNELFDSEFTITVEYSFEGGFAPQPRAPPVKVAPAPARPQPLGSPVNKAAPAPIVSMAISDDEFNVL